MPITLNIGAMRYKKANGEYDGFNSLGYPVDVLPTDGATAGQVPVADGLGSWAWGAQAGGTQTIQVSGTTPAITAVANTQYICGEVATLDITLPASGCIDVVFESGSTATVLIITPPTGVTVKWANGFDPDNLEANATYEINIKDGLGVGAAWT